MNNTTQFSQTAYYLFFWEEGFLLYHMVSCSAIKTGGKGMFGIMKFVFSRKTTCTMSPTFVETDKYLCQLELVKEFLIFLAVLLCLLSCLYLTQKFSQFYFSDSFSYRAAECMSKWLWGSCPLEVTYKRHKFVKHQLTHLE